jgi:hypothetical protein
MSESNWNAWYNREPGKEDPNLYVAGKVEVANTTDTVELVPGNIGTGTEPEYALKVVVTPAGIGLPRTDTKDVSWHDDVGQDYKFVRLDAEGEGTIARIDVDIVE